MNFDNHIYLESEDYTVIYVEKLRRAITITIKESTVFRESKIRYYYRLLNLYRLSNDRPPYLTLDEVIKKRKMGFVFTYDGRHTIVGGKIIVNDN